MAFVCTLVPDTSDEIVLMERAGRALARMCIGHDDSSEAVYSLLVVLEEQMGSIDTWEIHFDVIEMSASKQPINYKDGLETKQFLVGEDRSKTLDALCHLINLLLDKVRPKVAVMNTVGTFLPQKALRKYDLVCKAARDVGYVGRRTDPYHGAEMWLLKKDNS